MAKWITSSKTYAATAQGKELFPSFRSRQLRIEDFLVRDCTALWAGKKIQEGDTNGLVSFKDLTALHTRQIEAPFSLARIQPDRSSTGTTPLSRELAVLLQRELFRLLRANPKP